VKAANLIKGAINAFGSKIASAYKNANLAIIRAIDAGTFEVVIAGLQ
jgi:hypothetical protein